MIIVCLLRKYRGKKKNVPLAVERYIFFSFLFDAADKLVMMYRFFLKKCLQRKREKNVLCRDEELRNTREYIYNFLYTNESRKRLDK